MKFSPKCRTKKLGIILGSFCSFLIGKGPIFGPKSGVGKSLIMHAQLSIGARGLKFGMSICLYPNFGCGSNKGSDKNMCLHRLI